MEDKKCLYHVQSVSTLMNVISKNHEMDVILEKRWTNNMTIVYNGMPVLVKFHSHGCSKNTALYERRDTKIEDGHLHNVYSDKNGVIKFHKKLKIYTVDYKGHYVNANGVRYWIHVTYKQAHDLGYKADYYDFRTGTQVKYGVIPEDYDEQLNLVAKGILKYGG